MNITKANFTVRQGDLIAALYDEAMKETKDKKVQMLLVALALHDLRAGFKVAKKVDASKSYSAA